MSQFKQYKSEIDSSVNYTIPWKNSSIECRFVQRKSDQIIIYVSSQNGCKMACRFCHLTQMGLTEMDDVTPEMFVEQMKVVLYNHQNSVIDDVKLNINFMARGEALQNQHILNNWKEIEYQLLKVTGDFGIWQSNVKFNISTIIPKQINKSAVEIFNNSPNVHLYWSLYSFDEKFKKRWMPNASSIENGLNFLENWKNFVLHMCFIKNENDTMDNLYHIYSRFPAGTKMNIVRYNPYSDHQGEESDRIEEIYKFLKTKFDIQVIDRVGFDVAASCGMFLT